MNQCFCVNCNTPCAVYCGLLYRELISLSVRVRGCAGAVYPRDKWASSGIPDLTSRGARFGCPHSPEESGLYI